MRVPEAAKARDMSRRSRLTTHGAVSTALALHSDRALRDAVEAAAPLGSGIGGSTALLDVGGTEVFVKLVTLTERETRPESARSTANIHGVPAICHYGFGSSPGFGAWRELAVHTMTTDWVLAGHCAGFPLMYHWRVLPGTAPAAVPAELADVDSVVAYWGGDEAVRRLIGERGGATASLALFLEYIPENLKDWLPPRLAAGGRTADRACTMVARELAALTSFMNSRGLLHFDAHFGNILTDGRRLYATDFGLALSSRFELAEEEAAFFARHQAYDRGYTVTSLVHRLIAALYEPREAEHDALLRAFAAGARPTGIPAQPAAFIARHAPLAAVLTDFRRTLQQDARTPYPVESVRRLEGG
ncbi:Protein kinase domain-containing protein [Actinacidiphila cocklensis]|uniref:Protein kinase domain-containing protein n=2 Tax=Actinacidiphila cocklensis TaxID=887465 RepID=A0A9W4GWG8_9ACTN|nr:Protein kinase domain-containing protein [Actinacidiphila cocklensis]